ncbi:MAG: hypothetical protein RLZZ11_1612 [Cyanobacteriota bacterium]
MKHDDLPIDVALPDDSEADGMRPRQPPAPDVLVLEDLFKNYEVV